MTERVVMTEIGAVLIVASLQGKGISYGMPSSRKKPIHALTQTLRVSLFGISFLSVSFVLVGLLRP